MATRRGRSTQPQIADPYADLESLTRAALDEFGESAPETVDGRTFLKFIHMANEVLDEVMIHPYWTGGVVKYYAHPSDTRPVPDNVIRKGILAKFAGSQKSKATGKYEFDYYKTLNQVMTNLKFGPAASFEMRVVDQGRWSD